MNVLFITASGGPSVGSFVSLIPTLDQDSNDVGRLQGTQSFDSLLTFLQHFKVCHFCITLGSLKKRSIATVALNITWKPTCEGILMCNRQNYAMQCCVFNFISFGKNALYALHYVISLIVGFFCTRLKLTNGLT